MNKVILSGRLTREPEIRYSAGDNQTVIGRYTLAVKRRMSDETDFINCVVFGKGAEWAENYLHQGMKIEISGHIQTGSYTNKDGKKVYTTDVVVEEQDFAESKAASVGRTAEEAPVANTGGASAKPRGNSRGKAASTSKASSKPAQQTQADDGFMHMPEGAADLLFYN